MPGQFSPNQVNKWVVTSPGAKAVRHQIKTSGREQLLQQAEGMVPQYQTLVDRLTQHKLAPGDRASFQNIVGGNVTDYMEKYQENPYYAFSREGREKVRMLQSIVTNPHLTQLEESYNTSQENFKRANDDSNQQSFNVIGGTVAVMDPTGRIRRVSPGQIKPDEVPLTINAENQYRTSRGFYDQTQGQIHGAVGYNLVPYKEVLDTVNLVLNNTGSTEYNSYSKHITDIDSMLEKKVKTNSVQLRNKVNALLGEDGINLSQAHKDTLLAMAYQNQYQRDGVLNEDEAYKTAIGIIKNMAEGRAESSVITSESPISKMADGAGKPGPDVNQGGWEAMLMGRGVVPAKKSVTTPSGNYDVDAFGLKDGLFHSYMRDGVLQGDLPLNLNPVFRVIKAPGAQLTTTDGKWVDEAFTLPSMNPETVIYTDPADGQQYIEFNAISTDEGTDSDFVDESASDVRKVTSAEKAYWDAVAKRTEKLSESGKVQGVFRGDEVKPVWFFDDQYHVRVRTKYNKNASLDARLNLDNNSLRQPGELYKLPKSTEANAVQDQYLED